MGKWLDLAVRLEAEETPNDKRDASDESPPNVPFVPFVMAPPSLDRVISDGLDRLRHMRPPRIEKPTVWSGVVADATRLADDGWAAQAIALGWHPLQIFGCSPAVGGDPDLDSLAVWLSGRRLLLVDERSAVAADGDRRACFIRRKYDGAAFLWDLADIQSRRARKL